MSDATGTPLHAERVVLVCRLTRDAAERATHLAVRRQVFVGEQRLFAGTDADERDRDAATLHVLGLVDEVVGGAVRLYELGAGRWKGDRLAVLDEQRATGLGADLVRFAVATAAARGGEEMVADVQAQNLRFFERLGWRRAGGDRLLHGVRHVPVAISLDEPAP